MIGRIVMASPSSHSPGFLGPHFVPTRPTRHICLHTQTRRGLGLGCFPPFIIVGIVGMILGLGKRPGFSIRSKSGPGSVAFAESVLKPNLGPTIPTSVLLWGGSFFPSKVMRWVVSHHNHSPQPDHYRGERFYITKGVVVVSISPLVGTCRDIYIYFYKI